MKTRIFSYLMCFGVVGSLHTGWWSYICNGDNIELTAHEGRIFGEHSMNFSFQDWSVKLNGNDVLWKKHLLSDTEVKAKLDRTDYRSVSIYFPRPSFKEHKSGHYNFKTQAILEENKATFPVQKLNLDCQGVEWIKR
jgi:hypothetical protein